MRGKSGRFSRVVFTPTLLLNFNGSNGSTTFTDSSANAFPVTPSGGAEISTSNSKFGGASGYFDASTSSMLTLPDSAELTFGLDDFTVEFWCYPSSTDPSFTSYKRLVASGANTSWLIQKWDSEFNTTAAQLNVAVSGSNYISSDHVIFYDQWNHIAVTRSDGVFRGFVNGSIAVEITNQTTYEITAQTKYIGKDEGFFEEPFQGYLDDLRIVKGVALYDSDYVPPTSQL
jgi:hypothetical protein